MSTKNEKLAKNQPLMPNAKTQGLEGKEAQEQPMKEAQKPEIITVPVTVSGKMKGKNYVDLKGIAYNPQSGNLSLHLDDNHTVLLKGGFQEKYMGIILKSADKVEQSVKKAPQFEKPLDEKSNVRLKVLGERDGRKFLGPTGAAKYDGAYKGFVINLDDKHTTVLDAEMLSKELGIVVSPIDMEKSRNVGLGR